MKFILLMNAPRSAFDEYMSWPQATIDAHSAFMGGFAAKLASAGELAGGEGLALASEAKLVRASDDGQPITDGVFAESKEFLAGYWIIDVDDMARAVELAGELSGAPGRDGKPIYAPIEVRQVMSPRPIDQK